MVCLGTFIKISGSYFFLPLSLRVYSNFCFTKESPFLAIFTNVLSTNVVIRAAVHSIVVGWSKEEALSHLFVFLFVALGVTSIYRERSFEKDH